MPNANSKAAGSFFGLQNAEGSSGLARKILIIAQQLSTFSLPEERVSVSGASQVGAITGRGSVCHRLAIAAERGSQKAVDMFILPQDEAGAGVAATGTWTIAGTATEGGVLQLRVSGDNDLVAAVQVAIGDTAATIAVAILAELNKLLDAPVTFAEAATVITATAKNKGTYGNFISLEAIETVPAGLTVTVSAMSGGATDPDIDTALTATGNNNAFDTDLIHGYQGIALTLDKLSDYNGEGNDFVGLYQKEIARPFRSMIGDNVSDESTITAFVDTAARKIDRTSGVCSAPGCPYHPSDQAASLIGIMARVNAENPAGLFEGEAMSWLPVPDAADRYWELGSDGGYTSRDAAVRKGITPLIVIDGVYTVQNVNSFYHPDAVDEAENGWIDMSDISVSQNVLSYVKGRWEEPEWTGITFVDVKANVGTVNPNGTPLDRSKIKDRTDIVTELIELAKEMAGFGWLWNSDYTVEQIQNNPSYVTLRANGTGFDYTLPLWYRLKGYIKNGEGFFNVGGTIAAA